MTLHILGNIIRLLLDYFQITFDLIEFIYHIDFNSIIFYHNDEEDLRRVKNAKSKKTCSIHHNFQHKVHWTLYYIKVSQTRVRKGTAGGFEFNDKLTIN